MESSNISRASSYAIAGRYPNPESPLPAALGHWDTQKAGWTQAHTEPHPEMVTVSPQRDHLHPTDKPLTGMAWERAELFWPVTHPSTCPRQWLGPICSSAQGPLACSLAQRDFVF